MWDSAATGAGNQRGSRLWYCIVECSGRSLNQRVPGSSPGRLTTDFSMPTVRLSLPIYVPSWLHARLRKAKHAFFPPRPILADITGERDIEWTFISAEMPNGPGEALEFGCENGYASLMAAQRGFHVLAVDLQEQSFYWRHPKVEFRLGDFLELDLPRNHFDLVINCSSVEHVGVPGRYGITVEQSDGDIQVMQRFADILKPDGRLLMTAPCGRDAIMAPWCRVYGPERIPRLLAPFCVEKEA